MASGGIGTGYLIDTDIDDELFRFDAEDTPMLNYALRCARKVEVHSPEVEYAYIDKPKSSVTLLSSIVPGSSHLVALNLDPAHQKLVKPYTTLLVHGVDGYLPDGKTVTPGQWLMLYVESRDPTTNNPVALTINGPKNNSYDEISMFPTIPKGTRITVMSSALYETQKNSNNSPDFFPNLKTLYLQKHGMSQYVSDYLSHQKKRAGFTTDAVAEAAIADFKARSARTMWASRQGKLGVNVPSLGKQYIYSTEGIRWQFGKEIQMKGDFTADKLFAILKLFFTSSGDKPKSGILFAGSNFMELLQRVDFSKHPDMKVFKKVNKELGWVMTAYRTVFGEISVKHDPTLDALGWNNSAALIGEDRLTRYVFSEKHTFSDRVDREEASSTGIVIWDGLALKGDSNIWLDGEGFKSPNRQIVMWDRKEAPTAEDMTDNEVNFYLMNDCIGISELAHSGQMWLARRSGDKVTFSMSY